MPLPYNMSSARIRVIAYRPIICNMESGTGFPFKLLQLAVSLAHIAPTLCVKKQVISNSNTIL